MRELAQRVAELVIPSPRILRRNGATRLHDCDPLTGEVIRASKTTAVRYRPGELVHVDVKKLGRIPDGGGWKERGRQMGSSAAKKKPKIGFDNVNSMVDDHTRITYSSTRSVEFSDALANTVGVAAGTLAAALAYLAWSAASILLGGHREDGS